MAYKPEIQYVGQFYVHGSEAKKVAEQPKEKKAKTTLPLHRFERVQKVYVDPLAILSLLMAAALMLTMVVGAIHLQDVWHELDVTKQYVASLEKVNRTLEYGYRTGYDLEEVRLAAVEMGMVPAAEVKAVPLHVTVPQPEPEPTMWENIVWFMEGLFA
jgi:hypothetical protein